MNSKVDVIVPVYGGRDAVQRCVASVLKYPQQTEYRLVIINDASPEPDIQEALQVVADADERVLLLENAQN